VDCLEANVVVDTSGLSTVVVAGEVDLSSVSVLRRAIDDAWNARPKTLRIDVSNVTYFDSTGLREFTRTFEDCRRDRVTFEIVGASRNVRRVFVLTGLSYLLGRGDQDDAPPSEHRTA
jgi:anti-anti-sigma factor